MAPADVFAFDDYCSPGSFGLLEDAVILTRANFATFRSCATFDELADALEKDDLKWRCYPGDVILQLDEPRVLWKAVENLQKKVEEFRTKPLARDTIEGASEALQEAKEAHKAIPMRDSEKPEHIKQHYWCEVLSGQYIDKLAEFIDVPVTLSATLGWSGEELIAATTTAPMLYEYNPYDYILRGDYIISPCTKETVAAYERNRFIPNGRPRVLVPKPKDPLNLFVDRFPATTKVNEVPVFDYVESLLRCLSSSYGRKKHYSSALDACVREKAALSNHAITNARNQRYSCVLFEKELKAIATQPDSSSSADTAETKERPRTIRICVDVDLDIVAGDPGVRVVLYNGKWHVVHYVGSLFGDIFVRNEFELTPRYTANPEPSGETNLRFDLTATLGTPFERYDSLYFADPDESEVPWILSAINSAKTWALDVKQQARKRMLKDRPAETASAASFFEAYEKPGSQIRIVLDAGPERSRPVLNAETLVDLLPEITSADYLAYHSEAADSEGAEDNESANNGGAGDREPVASESFGTLGRAYVVLIRKYLLIRKCLPINSEDHMRMWS